METNLTSQPKTAKTLTSRIAYAFGAFGNDMFYGTLSTYFIMFVTTHLFNTGNQAENNRMILYITSIIAVLRIVELAIDPFIGNWIDRTKTRFGQFKPWVVVGGTITSIILLVLFTDLGGINRTNPILYLFLFAILYITMDIFYSFKDVAFWSMIPALSFSSKERERTAASARIGSTLGGGLVGVIVMPLVLFFSLNKAGGTGDARGWFVFALLVAVVGILTALAVGFGTHEVQSELRQNKENTVGFKQIFKTLAKNDQLMWIAVTYGIYAIGINILNSLVLYYFTFIMGASTQFSIFQMLNIAISLVSVSVFPKLVDKVNRRNLFAMCIGIMLMGIALFTVAGKSLVLVLIAAEMFQVPQAVIFLIVLMVISDCVEYGQWKLGHRDESLTLSIRPLLDKLGGAVSNGIVGQIAVVAGMTTGATAASITAHGQLMFKLMMFALPAVLICIALIVFWRKSTLTEQQHLAIVADLEKTWGQTAEPVVTHPITMTAPISGTLTELATVADPTFASGQAGQGIAIKPSDGQVFAPFDGTVQQVFSTRHAVGLVSDTGIAVLIHIGVDTVKLRGTGFVSYVTAGQRVTKGTKLLEFWDPTILKAGLDDTVMVTVTNSAKFKTVSPALAAGQMVIANQTISLTIQTTEEN